MLSLSKGDTVPHFDRLSMAPVLCSCHHFPSTRGHEVKISGESLIIEQSVAMAG